MAWSKVDFVAHVNKITAAFLNSLQDDIIDEFANSVKADAAQTFDSTKKAQARANIGAADADTLSTVHTKVINTTGFATCSTAAGTAAKTATIEGFTLVTGATVRIKFENTNTATSPSLNISDGTSNTGAKAIKMYGTTAAGTNPSTSWNAGEVVELVYDGTNWLMCKNFAITYDVVSTW